MTTAPAADIETLLAPRAGDAVGAPLRDLLRDVAAREPAARPAGREGELDDTLVALSRLNADGESIAAAILFAVPEWAQAAGDVVARQFPGVATLLDGLRAADQVWALHAERSRQGNAEGLRRLLLAMVRDLRVVPVLLARQLAQLRSATRAPEAERQALARITRDIHAPLANRLGIWQLKWELEDLSFRYLEPETYRRIASLLDDKRAGRERHI